MRPRKLEEQTSPIGDLITLLWSIAQGFVPGISRPRDFANHLLISELPSRSSPRTPRELAKRTPRADSPRNSHAPPCLTPHHYYLTWPASLLYTTMARGEMGAGSAGEPLLALRRLCPVCEGRGSGRGARRDSCFLSLHSPSLSQSSWCFSFCLEYNKPETMGNEPSNAL